MSWPTLPDSIEPQGSEVLGDRHMDSRWNLYQSCQSMREKHQKNMKRPKSSADMSEVEKEEQTEQVQGVIQSLVDARSELDVIRDVISVLEDQQQFLSMMHIPHSAVQHAAQRDSLIRQGLKKEQMHSISRRLRSVAGILKKRYCETMAFFDDLEYLKKRWLVQECERVGTSFEEDCAMVNISIPAEDDFDWLRHNKKSLGKHLFVLTSCDVTGELCALLCDPESPAGDEVVVVGREQIDSVLRRLWHARAWKFICRVLDVESEDLSNLESLRGILHPDVQRTVILMAHSNVVHPYEDARTTIKKHQNDEICSDPHMKYVAQFYETEMCALLFRNKALLMLENAMAWHHVPGIIRQATTTRRKTFLEQLCTWMKSASMWYEAAVLTLGKNASSSPLVEYIRASAKQVDCLPATIHLATETDTKKRLGSIVIQGDYSMRWVASPTENPEAAWNPASQDAPMGRLQLRHMLESMLKTNTSLIIEVEYT